MSGYRGQILRINLTESEITPEELDLPIAKQFVGGSGLAAYYYYQYLEQQQKIPEPLSPENILIFMTGVLTGLPAICTARANFCARSPLTRIWGESNIGGKFGSTLKFAGYDGIIIEGAAENPVYLYINDADVQIKEASKYWGMGTYETLEKLPNDLQDKKFKLACIGPAGEKLVKYAAIMIEGGRAAGRTGMGAVMGSKKLKAIVVKGSNRTFDLPERFREVAKQSHEAVKEDFMFELFQELGTSGYIDVALDMYGDMPIRNWSKGTFETGYKLSGATMAETILIGKKTCYRCPIGCGREIEIKEGRYKLPKTDGPEYETLSSFGTNLMIDDLEAVSYANYQANDFGLDTISTGAIIGLLFDLVEKGFVPSTDLPKGVNCTFSNIDALLTLLNLIAKKEGIGKVLAEGSKALAEKYGHPELAPQIARLEVPFHDPRAFSGMAIMYLTSPRGACHLNGDAYLTQQGLIFPEIGVDNLPDDRFANTGIAKQMVHLQNYRQLYNAMGICQLFNPPATMIAELLGMAMDEKISAEEMIIIGDRLFAIKQLINLKLGWQPEWQVFPEVMLQKLDGPTEGHVPDIEQQLKEWYEYRKYDRQTGEPTKEELERIGLTELSR